MAYWRRVHGNCYILLYRISSPPSYHVCPMAPTLRLRLVVASGEHLQLRLPDAEITSISGECCLVVQALYNSAPHVHRRYRSQGLRKQIAISGRRVCSSTACAYMNNTRGFETPPNAAQHATTCFPPELVQQSGLVGTSHFSEHFRFAPAGFTPAQQCVRHFYPGIRTLRCLTSPPGLSGIEASMRSVLHTDLKVTALTAHRSVWARDLLGGWRLLLSMRITLSP
jgi:hypothetical protein